MKKGSSGSKQATASHRRRSKQDRASSTGDPSLPPTRPSSLRIDVGFDPDAPATGDGIYGLPFTPDESRVVVLPVPFEATTSYGGGTADGPAAVLEASKQVDLFDRETGRPYAGGIAMLPIPANIAKWN